MGRSRSSLAIGAVLGLALAPLVEGQTVFYVDENATGPVHDGSTWCNAFLNVQDGLAAASSGDEIRVAEGTYYPDEGGGQTPGDRDATFEVQGVDLLGGFAGCGAPDPDAQDCDAYETILSGDLDGDDGPNFTNYEENSHHVLQQSTDDEATVDCITITHGYADDPPEFGSGGWGGGVAAFASGLTIKRCKIVANWGRYGGGLHGTYSSGPTVVDCIFDGNHAVIAGGAMFFNWTNQSTCTNCLVSNNTAPYGAGICSLNSSLKLVNGTISANAASDDFGGGIYLVGGLEIDNSLLWGNTDTGGSDQDAQIYIDEGAPTINYTSVQGWTGGLGGSNNDGNDPQFVDSYLDNDDFHPYASSPAINSGSNTYIAWSGEPDLDGNTRIVGGTVDRGCYEFQCTPVVIVEEDTDVTDLGCGTRNRYLGMVPNNTGELTALRVRLADLYLFSEWNGTTMWVGTPALTSESSGCTAPCPPAPNFWAARLTCNLPYMDWGGYGSVFVYDDEVVPSSDYWAQIIHVSCAVDEERNYSAPWADSTAHDPIVTSQWGDIVEDCIPCGCGPPDCSLGFDDISAVVDKVTNQPCAVSKTRADVAPDLPDKIVDFVDVPYVVDAFQGFPYPFDGPSGCP